MINVSLTMQEMHISSTTWEHIAFCKCRLVHTQKLHGTTSPCSLMQLNFKNHTSALSAFSSPLRLMGHRDVQNCTSARAQFMV